jgi:hypothetical protein
MPRNTITIGGADVELASDAGHSFLVDAVRAAEGLITDRDLVEIHGVSPPELQALAKDSNFARALRAERDRRVRDGTAARESAAQIFVRAPKVMGEILDNAQANDRHRIEAARELRAQAAPENTGVAANENRFSIVINLGADGVNHIESYTENRTINVTPEPPKSIESERSKLVESEPPKRRRGRPPKLKVIEQGSNDE